MPDERELQPGGRGMMDTMKKLFAPKAETPWIDDAMLERLKAEREKAHQEWKVRNWVACGDPAAGVSEFQVVGGKFYRIGEQVFFVPQKPLFHSFDGPVA
jgi:hypothetical protein